MNTPTVCPICGPAMYSIGSVDMCLHLIRVRKVKALDQPGRDKMLRHDQESLRRK